MDFWIKAAQFLLSLAILISLHELGHFLAARAFGIRVEKFYLFFDPWFSLFKKKIGDTEYGIGWLPLGGYVKIAGMIDESMDKEQMAQPPKPDEFRSKPAWQRLIVMIAGVTVNVILGFFIYTIVVGAWGDNVLPNDSLKYGLAVNKNFEKLNAGIQDGDKIIAVDGEKVENVNLINLQIFLRDARKLTVQKPSGKTEVITLKKDVDDWMWKHDAVIAFAPRFPTIVDSVLANRDVFKKGLKKGDSIVSINGVSTPFFNDLKATLANQKGDSAAVTVGFYREGKYHEIHTFTNKNKSIGFNVKQPAWLQLQHRSYSFGESITRGCEMALWKMHDYAAQLPLIFTSKGIQNVGGFGAIGNLFPAAWDWKLFWANTAFISLILAIMNILPIPALDGGHIVFLLYEMITGKEAPQKVLEVAQIVGFVILLALLIYANGNDIYKAFFK